MKYSSWKDAHLQSIGLQEARYTNIYNKIKGIRNLSRKDSEMIANIDPAVLGPVVKALAPMFEDVNEALEDGAGENSAAVQYAKDTPGQDAELGENKMIKGDANYKVVETKTGLIRLEFVNIRDMDVLMTKDDFKKLQKFIKAVRV